MKTRAQSLIYEIRKVLGLIPPRQRGKHATLEWRHKRARDVDRIASTSPAAEISAASGLYRLANWIGWCPRCGQPIAWSSDKPKPGEWL